MSRRLRIPFGDRMTDDELDATVAAARADIIQVLDSVLDDQAGLAQIYAAHGQQMPAPVAAEPAGQLRVVCDRITMLEAALGEAARLAEGLSASRLYLSAGRRFLAELRAGLVNRNVSQEEAFRLLFSVRHDLHQAENALRGEQGFSSGKRMHSQGSRVRDLISDMAGQMDSLTDQVMQLFRPSDEPARVPVAPR